MTELEQADSDALYLLSNESSFVTGQSLVVDGGLTSAARA